MTTGGSISSWLAFFKDAGIPSGAAKNYANMFDDNRITKDMLPDLDKEILREMGVRVMGDIIAILKHGRKLHLQELKRKERGSSAAVATKSAVKVAPIVQSAPASENKSSGPARVLARTSPLPAVTRVKQLNTDVHAVSGALKVAAKTQKESWNLTPVPVSSQASVVAIPHYSVASRVPISEEEEEVEGELVVVENPERQEFVEPELTAYGTLHSDQLLMLQPTNSPLVHEEYTTATYEARLKKKRAAGLIAEDQLAVSHSIPSKQPRMVEQPRVVEQSRVVEKSRVVESTCSLMPKKGVSSDPIQRSKRMLEAAGCYGLTSDDPEPLKKSVFSRLEVPKPSSLKPRVETSSRTTSSAVKNRLGNITVPNSKEKEKESGLYSDELRPSRGSVHARLGRHEDTIVPGDKNVYLFVPTMVADELEISQHSDVHARLKKQGKVPKTAVSQSSIGSRLGKHAVFNRLE